MHRLFSLPFYFCCCCCSPLLVRTISLINTDNLPPLRSFPNTFYFVLPCGNIIIYHLNTFQSLKASGCKELIFAFPARNCCELFSFPFYSFFSFSYTAILVAFLPSNISLLSYVYGCICRFKLLINTRTVGHGVHTVWWDSQIKPLLAFPQDLQEARNCEKQQKVQGH